MKHTWACTVLLCVGLINNASAQLLQQGSKLVGTGAVGSANQGWSVSLSADGHTAIVGGYSDNSFAGAAWVFTRSGGVWTQEGTKRVGTGAVGSASQGKSVSMSSDGNTAIVGGYGDNSNAGAAWMYINALAAIASVSDLPLDQGGNVVVNWNKSIGDAPPSTLVTEYWVWRGIRAASAPLDAVVLGRKEYVDALAENGTNGQTFTSTSGENGDFPTLPGPAGEIYWQYITSLPSHGLAHYAYACPTLADSTSRGIPWRYFFITAATSNPDTYWDSPVDSGYSVDNLSPGAVQSLTAQTITGSTVSVHWNKDVVDPDVGYYQVYRSSINGFTPNSSDSIGVTADTALTDMSAATGIVNYYRVVTVDIHGNRSDPSPQASAPVPASNTYSVTDRWNMVSVPLVVNDYHKSVLYPTAVSNAYTYQTGYVSQPILASGVGYWLKFNAAQSIAFSGLFLTEDTINVNPGWNMIGSISQSIPVTQVMSMPGGIVTSQFFGYQGTYVVSDTVEPGKAYWVKGNQMGKLILSASLAEPNKIRIAGGKEVPPAPPDGELAGAQDAPTSYALHQNYPNPFNPVTEVKYDLPENARVSLKLFSVLGQEVKTLVDEVQDAGFKTVSLDASNLASGIYFYRLQAGNFFDVKKMLLLK